MTLNFLPPQNWQEFEKFVKGVVEVIWKERGWQIYGRHGQAQDGIDIFGYDNNNKFVGIQCKKISQTNSEGEILTASLLKEHLIKKDIEAAKRIKSPALDRLIFTTTSLRDKKIQDIIRKEDNNNTHLAIEIWFWEDFQVLIERNIELMYWYYKDYLEKIQKYNPDIHILTLHKQAFDRPAFQRLIHREESGGDFLQAIKDTQEAIRTGRLYNRRGDLITSSYPTDKLSKVTWKDKFKIIYNELDSIRNLYNEGVKDGRIREHPTVLEIMDERLSNEFNEKRKVCLIQVNEVLGEAKLEKVESELI